MREISEKTTGDTLKAEVFNSNQREIENVVKTALGNILDPEGGPDSDEEMMAKAVSKYGAGGEFYTSAYSAPATYELTRSTMKYPPAYFTGMQILFVVLGENLAAPQIAVGTLGLVPLVQPDGSTIPNNYLQNGSIVEALFLSDKFYMINYQPAIKAIGTPRLEFIYSVPWSDASPYGRGIGYNAITSPVTMPIVQSSLSITGASFNDSTHIFILPRGYIYDVNIMQSFDDGSSGDSATRVYLADPGATTTPLLMDISNKDPNSHISHIRGLLNLKTTPPSTQSLALYIYTSTPGGTTESYAGKQVHTQIGTVKPPEIYTKGTIIQTNY